jgi:hypothetical protein
LDIEFLQPYKSRPQTSSLTANRRICAALGLKNPMSNDKTKTERQKIETARRKDFPFIKILNCFFKNKKFVTKKNKTPFGMVVFYLQHQQHNFF